MKTKIYNLYTADWESGSSYEFTHPEDRSEKFEADCTFLLRKYTPELLSKGGGQFYMQPQPGEKKYNTWCGVNGLIEIVAEKLPELGYIKHEDTFQTIDFGIFGSGIIEKYEEEGNIIELLGPELSKTVFNHNKKVQRGCDRKRNKYNNE